MALTLSDFVNERILIQIDDAPDNNNFRTLMVTLATGFAEYLGVLNSDIKIAFDLETAEGDQLDKIGAWVGVPRSGFDDDQYRINIKIQIEIIKSKLTRDPDTGLLGDWNGTVNNVLKIIRLFIGDAILDPIVLTNLPPYSFKVTIPGNLSQVETQTLFQFIKRTIYAAVLGYTIFLEGEGDNLWAHAYDGDPLVISVNEANTIFTDITNEWLVNDGAADFEPFVSEFAVDAACYWGFDSKWDDLYFNHETPSIDGVGITLVWEYWNGIAWTVIPGLTDGTNNMTSSDVSQKVLWDPPDDWLLTSVNGNSRFWVRAYINNIVAGTSPTYISGTFGGNDEGVQIGLWDAGAVANEARWSHGEQDMNIVSVDSGDAIFTNLTSEFRINTLANDFTPFVSENAVDGAIYFGNAYPFEAIYLDHSGGADGTDGVGVWEYWNGVSWLPVLGLNDGTNFFKSTDSMQVVSWDVLATWVQTTVNGVGPYYYVRARIDPTPFTITPTYRSGLLGLPPNGPYGVWVEGAVGAEGVWSGVLSTADGGIVLANDNT